VQQDHRFRLDKEIVIPGFVGLLCGSCRAADGAYLSFGNWDWLRPDSHGGGLDRLPVRAQATAEI